MPLPLPCGIALGSNLGDRLENLQTGLHRLFQYIPNLRLLAAASLYETAPVDCPPDAQPFYNSVIAVASPLSPHDLRRAMAAVEIQLGRPRIRSRNASRPIDLDLLYAGSWKFDDAELTLPHPRLAHRRFVLAPLAEIRPDLILPGYSQNVATLLAALPAGDEVNRLSIDWLPHSLLGSPE